MSAPELRAATADDAPTVAAIWLAGWRDGHLGHVHEGLVAARDDASFARRAARRITDTTVAVVDGQIAGFVMVVGDEVEQVYVDRHWRGTKVAASLLDDAERRITAAGHRQAWLAVVSGNARARRFYDRHGWVDRGEIDHSAEGRGDGPPIMVRAHRYTKAIPP